MKYTKAVKIKKNGLLQKIPGTQYFEVKKSFIWYLDYKNKIGKITVPEGFITNFGSIPRPFRPFIDKTKYIAYILHDYTWSKDCVIEFESGNQKVDFSESNNILEEALEVEGCGCFLKNAIYIGLQYTYLPYRHFKKCTK